MALGKLDNHMWMNETRSLFLTLALGKLDNHMWMNETRSLFLTYSKKSPQNGSNTLM
jgi:hypothetical protein